MTVQEFTRLCIELAETYEGKCYSQNQIARLFSQMRFCEVSEVQQAIDLMLDTEMRMPHLATFLAYTKPVRIDAAKRRKAELIAKYGNCDTCHNTGMVVVVENADAKKYEKTMRCGECQVANLLGILKRQPEYTHLGSRGIEPVILSKSLTATPSAGRIDEIRAMPKADRDALLKKEPWLLWPLKLYGNKSIPIEGIHKRREEAYEEEPW